MIVLERAEQEWARGVFEPPKGDWHRIDVYVREGLGWHWEKQYTKNRQFEWCGAFAAWCWQHVKPELRLKHFASTYRLYRWAKGTQRWVEPKDIQPGDIVVVGEKGRKWYGQHICIAAAAPVDGVVKTIEGNAIGMGPDGLWNEGVMKGERHFEGEGKLVMYAVRPLPEDLE